MHQEELSLRPHPKKELNIAWVHVQQFIRDGRTIKETKCQYICNSNNYRQSLHVENLYPDKNTRREHDSGNGEAISVSEIDKVFKHTNHDDGGYHQEPIDSREVHLSLDRLGSVQQADGGEWFHVNKLLD